MLIRRIQSNTLSRNLVRAISVKFTLAKTTLYHWKDWRGNGAGWRRPASFPCTKLSKHRKRSRTTIG